MATPFHNRAAPLGPRTIPVWREAVFPRWIFLAVALVVVTAAIVAIAVVQAVGRQVEGNTDRRLTDGAIAFAAFLDDRRADLVAVGVLLAADPDIQAATDDGDAVALEGQLANALRLPAVDEVLVTRPDGSILVRTRAGRAPGLDLGFATGLMQARVGRSISGVESDGERLELAASVPIGSSAPFAVLRVASLLDSNAADRFRVRSGLQLSLFFGQSRLVTTLRDQQGQPLAGVGASPQMMWEVVADGRPLLAWRELPIGRVRSYYLPLVAPDGARVGMFSVSTPAEDLQAQLRDALVPFAPVGAGITVLAAVAAGLLLRRLYLPILGLSQAAARLQHGDVTTPIPVVTTPELVPVANELERARAGLRTDLVHLAEEEGRQRALINALNEPLLTTDVEGRIRGWNVAATRLAARFFSEDVQSLRGRRIQELLPFLGADYKEGPWQGHLETPKGDAVDVQVTQAALAEGSLPVTDVYVLHDVSEQVELSRLREQLLFHVAHELRGPVTVLDNALELLTTAEEGTREPILPLARRNARQMVQLMGNLLSAANIQAGRFFMKPSTIDLAAVLKEPLDTLGDALQARSQTISHNLADLACPVFADAAYLQMVLLNLVTNASKYSPEGTNIEIEVDRLNDGVRVQVKDAGPGVPLEEQTKVFESFYRLPRDASQPGFGMGLAIVKQIVEGHGGTVGLLSEPGKGTTVWFTLPVAGTED